MTIINKCLFIPRRYNRFCSDVLFAENTLLHLTFYFSLIYFFQSIFYNVFGSNSTL